MLHHHAIGILCWQLQLQMGCRLCQRLVLSSKSCAAGLLWPCKQHAGSLVTVICSPSCVYAYNDWSSVKLSSWSWYQLRNQLLSLKMLLALLWTKTSPASSRSAIIGHKAHNTPNDTN
eukprot:GHRR01036022.1.p1 GENE.GHRR01036022.1~~GHRR01036022.1.p1  ORF type:complete len:118 (-),score=16.90 GHRR01036022.1:236-589(-)